MANANSPDDTASPHASTVFFSYSRGDQARARPLIDMLETSGFSVWWDGLLAGGERFHTSTDAALQRARAVVVLWSKTSVGSHWVHDEATFARDAGTLVPLSLDGSLPPLGFRQFQVIDLHKARMHAGDPHIQAFLAAVGALHGRPALPKTVTAPLPQMLAVNRRAALFGGGVAAAAAAGGAAWFAGLFGGGGNNSSIAVIPFANLSPDPAQRYFAEGLASELRRNLARNELLKVVAPTSSASMSDNRDFGAVARKLNAGWVLAGSVRKGGDLIRVALELYDGRDGSLRWSENYDRSINDVFSVQGEIASAVTAELSAEIGSKQATSADIKLTGGTKSVVAFDAYLRGRDLYDAAVDEASDRMALAKFDEAIANDNLYAAAHAARSRALAVIANQYAKGAERRSLYERAVVAANRAVELAPRFAEAHSALGYALAFGRLDIRAAIIPYDRSLELGRGDADILSRYALFRSRSGKLGSAQQSQVGDAMQQSLSLDPLNARTFRTLGVIRLNARDYPAAITAFERCLQLQPKISLVNALIGQCRWLAGDRAAAAKAFAAEPNSLFRWPGEAMVAKALGNPAAADAAVAELVREHGDNSLYQQAQVFAQWGDIDRAVAALQAARKNNDGGMISVYVDPLLDPVRTRAEFGAVLAAMHFV